MASLFFINQRLADFSQNHWKSIPATKFQVLTSGLNSLSLPLELNNRRNIGNKCLRKWLTSGASTATFAQFA